MIYIRLLYFAKINGDDGPPHTAFSSICTRSQQLSRQICGKASPRKSDGQIGRLGFSKQRTASVPGVDDDDWDGSLQMYPAFSFMAIDSCKCAAAGAGQQSKAKLGQRSVVWDVLWLLLLLVSGFEKRPCC